MRIGVLGGSFDPPHLGHAALAAAAEAELQLDLVLWLVAAEQWQKHTSTPADVRAHLVELAVAEHRTWQVSQVDLDRGGPTYTIDSIAELEVGWPDAEFVFLLGADAVAGLPSWHRATELGQRLKFAAARRAGKPAEAPAGFDLTWLQAEVPPISSTAVRELAKHGAAAVELAEFVQPTVAEYITEVGLYR